MSDDTKSDGPQSTGVDSGYGSDAPIERSQGGMETNRAGKTETQETEDSVSQSSVTADPNLENELQETRVSTRVEEELPWTTLTNNPLLAEHAQEVADDAPGWSTDNPLIPQYDSQLKTYIGSRPSPVYNHLTQINVSVPPEVGNALEKARLEAAQYFEDDEFNQADFYSALLIRGLMSFDSALGIMALKGYGMKD